MKLVWLAVAVLAAQLGFGCGQGWEVTRSPGLDTLRAALGERDELLRRERLLPEEDHVVIEEQRSDLPEARTVERRGEVDARDLGTDVRAQPLD